MEGVREQVSAEETPVAVPVPQEDQQRPEEQLVEGPPRPLRTPEETPVRRERPGEMEGSVLRLAVGLLYEQCVCVNRETLVCV